MIETVSPPDEERFDTNLSPRELTLFNARRKGTGVAHAHPDRVIIAADTLVALAGETVALKVTDCPATDGLGFTVTLVVVAAFTVWVYGAELPLW